MVLQLLLKVGDLGSGLATLACKALVHCTDWNIDEPKTGDQPQMQSSRE